MAPPCSRVNRASICAIRPASCMAGGPSRSSTAPQAARANRCCPPASAIRPSRPKPIFSVQFYRPPAARCEGCIVSRGRRIISTEACVKDQAGKVLAHGTSALMVLGARDWRKAAGDEDSRARTGICLYDGTREGALANRGIWLAKSAPGLGRVERSGPRLRAPADVARDAQLEKIC